MLVEESNARAVRMALKLKGLDIAEADKELVPYTGTKRALPEPDEKVMELLNTKPRIVNVGVESFNESIVKYEGKSVQFDWKPMAGGNKKMIGILSQLKRMEAIDEMNQKVVEDVYKRQAAACA